MKILSKVVNNNNNNNNNNVIIPDKPLEMCRGEEKTCTDEAWRAATSTAQALAPSYSTCMHR